MILNFSNDALNLIANDCGLYIAEDNSQVTSCEVEFFVEEVLRECKSLLDDESKKIIDKHFGLVYHPNPNQLELF